MTRSKQEYRNRLKERNEDKHTKIPCIYPVETHVTGDLHVTYSFWHIEYSTHILTGNTHTLKMRIRFLNHEFTTAISSQSNTFYRRPCARMAPADENIITTDSEHGERRVHVRGRYTYYKLIATCTRCSFSTFPSMLVSRSQQVRLGFFSSITKSRRIQFFTV